MSNALVKLLGWRATILHGDPAVVDRWRWLSQHLVAGDLATLDAGCGSGAFTLYAGKIGNRATGISFDEANMAKARARAEILGLDRVHFLKGDLRELDRFELPPFDQVICCETIEHIMNDRKLLRDIAGMLRVGGRLLLTAPYKHYRGLLGDFVTPVEDGGHVRWGYTHDEFRTLLDEAGFQVESEAFISGVVSQQLANATRLLDKIDTRLSWATVFPFRTLKVFDSVLTSLLRYPHLSVGVVATKRPHS